MPEEKPKQNNLDDPEISRLRDVVLQWVEKSKGVKKPSKSAGGGDSPTAKVQPVLEIKNPIAKFSGIKDKSIEKKSETPLVSSGDTKNLKIDKPVIRPTLQPLPKKIRKNFKLEILSKIIFGVVTIAALGIMFLGAAVYGFGLNNQLVNNIAKFIPLPAIIINYQVVTYNYWQTQVDSLENFYATQVAANKDLTMPSQEDIGGHIMNRIIENTILEQKAKSYDIVITDQELNIYIDKLTKEIGNQAAFESQIKNLYNWSVNDFKKEIVKPLILKSKLASAIIADDRLNRQARLSAQQALAEAKKGEVPFEVLAQKYSEDITAVQGGDLGYFSTGQLEPDFEKAAFALKPGETSDVVKTKYGFHIIKVTEALTDETGKTTQIRAQHILIRGQDLNQFLEEAKKTAKIWQLVTVK